MTFRHSFWFGIRVVSPHSVRWRVRDVSHFIGDRRDRLCKLSNTVIPTAHSVRSPGWIKDKNTPDSVPCGRHKVTHLLNHFIKHKYCIKILRFKTCVIKRVFNEEICKLRQVTYDNTFVHSCPEVVDFLLILLNRAWVNRGSLYYYGNFYVFFSLLTSSGALRLGGICFTIAGYGN